MNKFREQADLGGMETQYMTVGDLVSALQSLRPDMEVYLGQKQMEIDDIDVQQDKHGIYLVLGGTPGWEA